MQFGVVLDLDGTLVDSVYHHVVAWDRALATHGYAAPLARIHRGIGMSGDRLVSWLLGGPPDDMDAISGTHEKLFLEQRDRLRATAGAVALLDDLHVREVPVVIATSAGSKVREALMQTLGDPDLPITDADAVGDSKPAADLLVAACEQIEVEPTNALLVGDSPWDVAAADRVGLKMIAVRAGGFGDDALRARGPATIVDAPADLIGTL